MIIVNVQMVNIIVKVMENVIPRVGIAVLTQFTRIRSAFFDGRCERVK